jgi:hypothetical protein
LKLRTFFQEIFQNSEFHIKDVYFRCKLKNLLEFSDFWRSQKRTVHQKKTRRKKRCSVALSVSKNCSKNKNNNLFFQRVFFRCKFCNDNKISRSQNTLNVKFSMFVLKFSNKLFLFHHSYTHESREKVIKNEENKR